MRQQGKVPGSFNGLGYLPLVAGTGAENSFWDDFASLGDKATENFCIFVINY